MSKDPLSTEDCRKGAASFIFCMRQGEKFANSLSKENIHYLASPQQKVCVCEGWGNRIQCLSTIVGSLCILLSLFCAVNTAW